MSTNAQAPMPKPRRSSIGYKPKKGTGNSKETAAQREIVSGKSSGGWVTSTHQADEVQEQPECSNSSRKVTNPTLPNTSIVSKSLEGAGHSTAPRRPPSTGNSNMTISTTTPARPIASVVTPTVLQYKWLQILSSKVILIDRNAFSRKRGGNERSSQEAGKRAKRRQVKKVVDTIMENTSDSKRALVLKEVLECPGMAPYTKAVGYPPPEETKVALFHKQQQQEAIAKAYEKNSTRGRVCNDRSDFIDSVVVASAPNVDAKNAPSLNSQA